MGKDNSLFEWNGKTYKLVRKPDSFGCTEICPLALANKGNCEALCSEAFLNIEFPEFRYYDCMFVEVTETENETTKPENNMKEIEKIGNDTFKYNGKVYRVVQKESRSSCLDTCPLHGIYCERICKEMYRELKNPCFEFADVVLVEIPENENKEINMEEKEPKNEPNYKALYEQEHKKYGDAVERMKSWMNGEHPECFSEAHKAAEFVFPELKGSKDERIRKALLDHIKGITDWNYFLGISREQMIAWLEKQGERTTNKNDFDRGYDVGISAAKFNQWKPTEEQMKALKGAAFDAGYEQHFKKEDVLESLIEDLKKL